MRKGVAVSPGVAVGKAYCIHEIFVNPDTKRLEDAEITAELACYEAARDKTSADLRSLQEKVSSQVGRDEAAIFAVQESILRDAPLTGKIRQWIAEERMTAQAALHRLLSEYGTLFSRTRDEYLRERLTDLRDVVVRLSSHISDVVVKEVMPGDGPIIIVADELLPSQVVAMGSLKVSGIVTQAGSQTSHAAILARNRGIPAVSGVRGLLRQVTNGDIIVVDGREGHVDINPDSEALAAYRKLQREFFDLKDHLAANRDLPARSADGETLDLLANINGEADAEAAKAMGATGVGLYRTEYYYLTHPSVPDEEEQVENYTNIVEKTPGHTVTIRTLDIGGDKTVPYLGHTHAEANPFMGWRSIRLSFEHPEFFITQIRAVLRAGHAAEALGGEVRLLFPMVTTVEELRRLRSLVRRAQNQLKSRRKKFGKVPIGMMLEVPAAAVCIETMLEVADFVSIGSNDLVQYLMAADRDNPKVNHLCQPLSPPVLKVLANVISACNAADKPVTLCGEMAGQPSAFVALYGMGLRSFSMSPSFIPTIKELAGHLSRRQAGRILAQVLRLKTTAQVKRLLHKQVGEIAPDLSILETA